MRSLTVVTLFAAARFAAAYDTIEYLPTISHDDLKSPVAAAAARGRTFVLDEKRSSLFIFDDAGRLLKEVGGKGEGPSEFKKPQGVAIGPDGRVFVADTGNDRIQILDAEGNFLSRFGEGGGEPGRLRGPESVAVVSDGRIYVADTGNDRIQVFTQEGILLFTYGKGGKEEGRFSGPTRVAVDPSENVYVWDSGNDRIQMFSPKGHFAKKFEYPGDDFVVDPYGFFYVLDGKRGKIAEVSPSGNVMGRFGSPGKGPGQSRNPQGIALSEDGTVLVVDTGNRRVQRVKVLSKVKTQALPGNFETKMLVSGPSASLPVKASLLRAVDGDIFAYLPENGQFAVFDLDGREKRRFGADGKGENQTRDPKGFAVSAKHGIYVSDTYNNRIQRFSGDGAWKVNFAEKDGLFDSRKKEGRVQAPFGAAINEEGTVYVADSGNRRVEAFSPEGVFLFAIGPNVGGNELEDPVALVWDPKGFLFILDKGLKKVFQCKPSGALVNSFGGEGEGPGQFKSPSAMASDGKGYLYILDDKLGRVSVFSNAGLWLTDLLSSGGGRTGLSEPSDLALSGAKLLISDQGQNRIAAFDLKLLLAAPVAVSSAVKGGVLELSWKPVEEQWLKAYHIERALRLDGPWEEVGVVANPSFEDSKVVSYETYFYRVASEAGTGHVGIPGPPIKTFVPGSFNRSPVEIASVTIGNIFPSNYKWYLNNPVGEVLIVNNTNLPFRDLKVSFRFKEFMDFGYDKKIELLNPQESVAVALIATFNNKILEVTEDTPVQAELKLTYFEKGKQRETTLTQALRVYSRNAVTWQDPRRIANFITPKDPPIVDFSRDVLRETPSHPEAGLLNQNLVKAMHLWDALSEAGVTFFSSPNNPYEKISEDPNFPVDITQFPRETLRRKTGECDDLVTLIASLMEASQLETALLDYPGHISLMFDTGSNDPLEIGIAEDSLIRHQGSLWIPLEATFMGKSFTESMEKALHAYKAERAKGRVTVIDVSRAWEIYEPATMPTSDFQAEAPSREGRLKRFNSQAGSFARDRYDFLKKEYLAALKAEEGDLDVRIDLGILEHEYGNEKAAREQFEAALKTRPGHAGALNNLGNVEFLAKEYGAAEALYLKAAEADPQDPEIFMNLARNALKLRDEGKIKDFGAKAVALDGERSLAVDSLLKKYRDIPEEKKDGGK